MRDLDARLNAVGALPAGRLDAIRASMRRVAQYQLDKAMTAPCGCNPTIRCDRHCRATIRPGRDLRGRRSWSAECNGVGDLDYSHESDRVGCGDLWSLHEWATEHVARHRLRAFARTE